MVTDFEFLGNTSQGNSEGNNSGEYVHVDRMDSNDDYNNLSRFEIDRLLQIEKLKEQEQKAKAAQFDTDIREGKLLLAEDVAKHDAEVGSQLKKKLLALPTELAVRLAALSSPAEVEGLLRAEITSALNEFLDAYGVHYS